MGRDPAFQRLLLRGCVTCAFVGSQVGWDDPYVCVGKLAWRPNRAWENSPICVATGRGVAHLPTGKIHGAAVLFGRRIRRRAS
jgi:hypothetical protein